MNNLKFRWVLEGTVNRDKTEDEQEFGEWCEEIKEFDKDTYKECITDFLESCDTLVLKSAEYS